MQNTLAATQRARHRIAQGNTHQRTTGETQSAPARTVLVVGGPGSSSRKGVLCERLTEELGAAIQYNN